jgi:hypothetical protein
VALAGAQERRARPSLLRTDIRRAPAHPDTSEAKALKLKGDAATAYNDIVYAGYAHPLHQLFGCKNTDLDDDADEVLVLSLASDKKLGMKWGDDNRLNFYVSKKHFAKGRFAEAYPACIDA